MFLFEIIINLHRNHYFLYWFQTIESGMQSRTYSIACDCKSPNCTWQISCLITFQAAQSGYPKNDFRFFNRILPYHSLLRMPTLISCPSLGNAISHNNYHCAKNFRSKSHPQVKDTVRSKLLATYKRGIRS